MSKRYDIKLCFYCRDGNNIVLNGCHLHIPHIYRYLLQGTHNIIPFQQCQAKLHSFFITISFFTIFSCIFTFTQSISDSWPAVIIQHCFFCCRVVMSRLAVVSGGSRGIGRAVSQLLAQRGHRVVVLSRNKEAAQATAESLPGGESVNTIYHFELLAVVC